MIPPENRNACTVYSMVQKPIIRHLNICIFCMMSVHNAQKIVKITICRDRLLQDTSSAAQQLFGSSLPHIQITTGTTI